MVKNVLLYAETWGHGGIEAFALDEVAAFSNAPVAFTLFSVWKCDSVFDKRLEELGIETHFCFDSGHPSLAKRCLVGWRRFDALLKQRRFDVVHINTMNGAGLMYARIAKRRGVSVVVAHSRNARYGEGYAWAKELAHRAGKRIAGAAPDVRLACSQEAGRYLFDSRSFDVLKRGINADDYTFDPEVREEVRAQLGIPSDAFVVGNVGRVSEAKNPLFQVEVFEAVRTALPEAVFVLVGDGDLREQRDEAIHERGLEEAVCAVGASDNVARYYSACDCLIMPSLYEGMPNVALEAQCNGLPIVLSDAITPDVIVADIARSCALSAGADAWAQVVLETQSLQHADRAGYAGKLAESGYSVGAMRRELEEYYQLG